MTGELSHKEQDNRELGNKPAQEPVCKQHEEHNALPYTARTLSDIVEPEWFWCNTRGGTSFHTPFAFGTREPFCKLGRCRFLCGTPGPFCMLCNGKPCCGSRTPFDKLCNKPLSCDILEPFCKWCNCTPWFDFHIPSGTLCTQLPLCGIPAPFCIRCRCRFLYGTQAPFCRHDRHTSWFYIRELLCKPYRVPASYGIHDDNVCR